jgi:hypothetical protein
MGIFEDDLIGYDKAIENAMRNVIYTVIKKVSEEGLPGEHYFCIVFKTQHKDVILPEHIRKNHPDTIKVVLQHRFEITEVTSEHFNVVLSFGGVEENVRIPFDSIVNFTDPHMKFCLDFNPNNEISREELDELVEEYEYYLEEEPGLENYKENDKNVGNKIICFEEAKKNLAKKQKNNKK